MGRIFILENKYCTYSFLYTRDFHCTYNRCDKYLKIRCQKEMYTNLNYFDSFQSSFDMWSFLCSYSLLCDSCMWWKSYRSSRCYFITKLSTAVSSGEGMWLENKSKPWFCHCFDIQKVLFQELCFLLKCHIQKLHNTLRSLANYFLKLCHRQSWMMWVWVFKKYLGYVLFLFL